METIVAQVSSAFIADPELLAELEKRAEPVALGPNRVLFRQGEDATGVYIVRKGTALMTSKVGDDTVLSVAAGAGSLLGVPAVIAAKTYSLTAEAMEGAELSVLNGEDFVHLMHTDPSLAFLVLQVLAEEVRFARAAVLHQ